MEDEKIFEDNDNVGIHTEDWFTNNSLEEWKLELGKSLLDKFPNTLLESEIDVYGCPDCWDQGGFYLRLISEEEDRIWMIDTRNDEQNQEIIDYKNKVNEILDQL